MRTPSLIRVIFILAVAGLLSSAAAAQKKPPVGRPVVNILTSSAAPQSAESLRRQIAFATAWETLNRQYYDKTFGGVDWNKIRAEFTPKVAAAKTDHEFHEL